jgi:hypothetical protein
MLKVFSVVLLSGFALAATAAEGPLVGPGVTGKKLANDETVGADVGAGPHLERNTTPAPRVEDAVDEIPPASRPENRNGDASTGSSDAPNATQGSSGADNDAIEADEARASKNKDKFKQRPGFKEDPPQPRAEAK